MKRAQKQGYVIVHSIFFHLAKVCWLKAVNYARAAYVFSCRWLHGVAWPGPVIEMIVELESHTYLEGAYMLCVVFYWYSLASSVKFCTTLVVVGGISANWMPCCCNWPAFENLFKHLVFIMVNVVERSVLNLSLTEELFLGRQNSYFDKLWRASALLIG